MAAPTDDLKGAQGELVTRLVAAVFAPEDRDWMDLGIFLANLVGGDELDNVMPDDRKEHAPGTVGALMHKTATLVGRREYSERAAARILQLVRSGVREDFLVRALRDELTATMHHMAHTEVGNTRRKADAARMQETVQDPAAIESFRRSWAKTDPEAAKLSDEEIAKQLGETAERFGKPMSRKEEQDHWARSTRWSSRAQAVSDQVIETWRNRNMALMLQNAKFPWDR
jgi:hypothetical protein